MCTDTFARIRHWVCLFFLCSYLCVIRMKSRVLIQFFFCGLLRKFVAFSRIQHWICVFWMIKLWFFYCGIHLDCMFDCGFFLLVFTCNVACGLIQSKTWSPANLCYLRTQIWPRFLLHDLFICMCIAVSFFILNCHAVELALYHCSCWSSLFLGVACCSCSSSGGVFYFASWWVFRSCFWWLGVCS